MEVHNGRKILLSLVTALLVALAGCSDEPGETIDNSTGTATDTGTTDATEYGTGTTTGTGTSGPQEEVPEPRNETVSLASSLGDCTVLSEAAANGAPADAAASIATVSLTDADWNRTYTLTLTSEASEGMAPSALCVGFEGLASLAPGDSGTIPAGTDTMYIGGDFVFQGEVQVTIG